MSLNNLKSDFLSSLVVFIIAIPLTLGIAMASGAPVESAIVAAIIGGIVVGLLSGAPLVVSGPAAGLVTIVYQNIQDHGLQGLFIITLLAGALQMAMSLFKLGTLFEKFPKLVLKGMLTAIGLIIINSQLHVLIGHSAAGSFTDVLKKLILNLQSAHVPTLALGLLAITCLFYFKDKMPTKLKFIPVALPVVIIGTLVSLFIDVKRITISDSFASGVSHSFRNFDFSQLLNIQFLTPLILPAIVLAVVASAESLLTAKAISDSPASKNTSLNKELFAQGAGNLLSGLLSGLPITGVIVRSAANINSGAKTRMSTILHSVWILMFVILFTGLLAKIPLVLLSSVLIATGINLLNMGYWLSMLKSAESEFKINFGIGFITILSILFISLLNGLIIGLALYVVNQNYRKVLSKIRVRSYT